MLERSTDGEQLFSRAKKETYPTFHRLGVFRGRTLHSHHLRRRERSHEHRPDDPPRLPAPVALLGGLKAGSGQRRIQLPREGEHVPHGIERQAVSLAESPPFGGTLALLPQEERLAEQGVVAVSHLLEEGRALFQDLGVGALLLRIRIAFGVLPVERSVDAQKRTSPDGLFQFQRTFDEDLSSWDTSKVTDMNAMFLEARSFDGDVSNFDTSKVTSMADMFARASSFNGDVSNWDTSKVTSMGWMFWLASSFNGDVSNFDTSRVTSMGWMFCGASAFNEDLPSSAFNGDVSNFDTSKVTDMSYMFWGASSFNGDVSKFDTSKVTDMESMFRGASSFNGNVGTFDTSKVTDMAWIFYEAYAFNGNVSNWNTSSVTDMKLTFYGASSFNQDVGRWDVASVTDMRNMFERASSFNHNLCAWGVHYNATVSLAEKNEWVDDPYDRMFLDTDCPNQNDPAGPDTNWCAATCNSAEQTESSSPPP